MYMEGRGSGHTEKSRVKEKRIVEEKEEKRDGKGTKQIYIINIIISGMFRAPLVACLMISSTHSLCIYELTRYLPPSPSLPLSLFVQC